MKSRKAPLVQISVAIMGVVFASFSMAANLPDLVVTGIGWSPSTVMPGDAVTFQATVKNQGTLATPAGVTVGVAFTVDGQTVNWSASSTAALAPGASRVLSADGGPGGVNTWTATTGSHVIGAWVDDVNRIAENIETNNQLSQPLTVGSPPGSARLFGYSVHLLDQPDPDIYAALAANGRAQTIREDLPWASTETSRGNFNWTQSDKLMTFAARYGLRLLIIVNTSPQWASTSPSDPQWWLFPPTNPEDYGNFVGQVAARYGANGSFWASHPTLTKVLPAGIEIWNEPNTGGAWKSGPDPMKYTAMLKAAYRASKSVDTTLPIVAGALAPHGGYNDGDCDGVADDGTSDGDMNGLNFLETVYQNGGAGSFDAVSTHPYNFSNNATAAQMLTFHVCSAWSQMVDTSPSVRSLMIANGDGAKKIWATELGAPTKVTNSTYNAVTEVEQGKLATQQLNLWKGFAWSGNFYWYDLRDDGRSLTNSEDHFGAARADNSAKPAYTALRNGYPTR